MLTTPRRRSLKFYVAWSLPLVFIYAQLIFGVVAENGYNDYTKRYTIVQALKMTSAVPWNSVKSGPLWFIPISLMIIVVAELALRRPWPRALVFSIGLCRALLPILPVFLMVPVLMLFAPVVTASMLTGTSGETYAEGMPIWAALGWWVWLQVAWLVRDMLGRDAIGERCVGCLYPRAGLTPSANCPECGAKPARETAS